MKKILVINNLYREYGGEDANIVDEIKFLNKYYDVEYLEYDNSGKIDIFDVFGFTNNTNFKSNRKLLDILNRFKPDVAYVHNTWFKCNLGIFKILKNNNINTLLKIHNYRISCGMNLFISNHLKDFKTCPACGLSKNDAFMFNKYYPESYLKSIFLIKYSNFYIDILKKYPLKILVLSEFQKKFLSKIGINEDKIFIYLNPIELNTKNFSTYNPNSKDVVFAGRLVKEKGIMETISSWQKVADKNMTLNFVGSGELLNKLRNSTNDESIRFLGQKDNVETKRIIQNSRAFISSTKLYEGQPRSLLEASSYGVPSVYPSFGGMDEFFPDNYKLSFEQYNYKSLNEKIKLLRNSSFMSQESKKIINFMSANLNEDKLINTFNEIVQKNLE